MELREYVHVLLRRKWIITITIIATMIVVAIGTSFATPVYQTYTTLRVATSAIDTLNPAIYGYNDQLMNTYVKLATSRPILDELASRLAVNHIPTLTVQIVPNTELINIIASDSDPTLAAKAANTLAEILATQKDDLFTGGNQSSKEALLEQLDQAQADLNKAQQAYEKLLIQTPPSPQNIEVARQYVQLQQTNYGALLNQYELANVRAEIRASMITVVETANVPNRPISPRTSLNYMLGLFAGLLAGVGLAFVFENIDAKIHSSREIKATTPLNIIASLPSTNKKLLNISSNVDSPLAEAFRKLVFQIQAKDPKHKKKSLLVMSAVPHQGTTVVAANLSLALTEQHHQVVLVDCNLRQPGTHSFFSVPNEHGLVDVLERKMGLNEALQAGPNDCIHILTSGITQTPPGQLLMSRQMEQLLDDLSQQFDFVLLDAPALFAAAETNALIELTNGIILVVRNGHIQREALHEASQFLQDHADKVIGMVINEAETIGSYKVHSYTKSRAGAMKATK